MATASGVLLVDKHAGFTSHDVVAIARRALSTRRVGHTGTLDPMATGLLVLTVGEATKLSSYMMNTTKEYEATLELGRGTDTLDADGQVVAVDPTPPTPSPALLESIKPQFLGTITQRAPAFSAIKQQGQPLYRAARRGEEVHCPVREVSVEELSFTSWIENSIKFRVRSGPGFYVRALGRDLAQALGTQGHLSALRRTRSGTLVVHDALDQGKLPRVERGHLGWLSLHEVCRHFPKITCTDEQAKILRSGGRLDPNRLELPETTPNLPRPWIAWLEEQPIALVELKEGSVCVLRGFNNVDGNSTS